MTIRKYLGCDGPECISNLEVELESPLRDILPGNWTAIMIPGDQKQDYHFCSLDCLAKFAIRQTLKDDEDGTAGAGVLVQPKPGGDLDSGAVTPAAHWLSEQLRQVMAGIFNPPKSYTYTWPNVGMAGARWDASPYMAMGGAAGNWYSAPAYHVATDTAGALLR